MQGQEIPYNSQFYSFLVQFLVNTPNKLRILTVKGVQMLKSIINLNRIRTKF